jgi:regulator of sigma E protease
VPALDGGRLFFILIEAVTGKKVNQRFESVVHTIGMIVLLALMALITFKDVGKLFVK